MLSVVVPRAFRVSTVAKVCPLARRHRSGNDRFGYALDFEWDGAAGDVIGVVLPKLHGREVQARARLNWRVELRQGAVVIDGVVDRICYGLEQWPSVFSISRPRQVARRLRAVRS